MEFHSSLTLLNSDTTFLLEKRIQLLTAIDRVGSISKAAKEVPMSYKAAWDAITAINNLCPTPIVVKETGGKGGGGAKLTTYGQNLLSTYTLLQKEHQKFLTHLTKMTDFNTGALKSIQRVAMQISARNQIQGKIEHIEQGKINSCVFIKLKSGYSIVSVITNSAVDSLSLKNEDEVIAIFKSSSVLLTADLTLNISARNKFQGEVIKVTTGEVNSEVILDIGGDTIASVITTDAVKSLDIKVGDKMSAIIKSSDTMIGK
ncbi:MAG: TOBE domain-containing protein [Arcobacter sp.]|uniref:TOBE domain-containing protein n=1 Tax=Arcobacter sp. TaxID=1872629 RepID=UPI003AFFBC84